jgi:hypothetical protein
VFDPLSTGASGGGEKSHTYRIASDCEIPGTVAERWIGRERTSYECALADAVVANPDAEVVGLAGEVAA